MRALMLITGLGAGNFIAQAICDGDYATALERTFFQAVAVLAYRFVSLKDEEKVR